MIVRNLDIDHDWTFGAGKNNYRTNYINTSQDIQKTALAQCIVTRLLCFLGDCFFDLTAGIDWPRYLGSRNQQDELQMQVASTILGTENVISILKLDMSLSRDRKISLQYTVDTTLGELNGEVEYNT